MKSILTTPFNPISSKLSSHRAAQGVIYADQLVQQGEDVVVSMSKDTDYSPYDKMFIYHGNDWFGTLNLFGGVKEFAAIKNFVNFSKFTGKVYSLIIPCPDYHTMLQERMKGEYHLDWNDVDWDNLKKIQAEAEVVIPGNAYKNISIGDSHAICLYRPGWINNSNPFKTLHGALKTGLDSFLTHDSYQHIEYYFGNIDVRHHLLRQSDPTQATKDLVAEYVKQAKNLSESFNCQVSLYELLPIENESRSLPKTGYYKGTPFSGTQQERDVIRRLFKDELKLLTGSINGVNVIEWVDKMINDKGELDFKFMEKPKSVHLSREYYPHWQGLVYNSVKPTASLESFFT